MATTGPRPHSPATSSASSISLRSSVELVVDDRSLNRLTSYLSQHGFICGPKEAFSPREKAGTHCWTRAPSTCTMTQTGFFGISKKNSLVFLRKLLYLVNWIVIFDTCIEKKFCFVPFHYLICEYTVIRICWTQFELTLKRYIFYIVIYALEK